MEFCATVVSIKYAYKYITKGPDRCLMSTKTGETEDLQGAVNLNEDYQEMSPTSKLTCHSWSRFSHVIDKTKMLTEVKFQ